MIFFDIMKHRIGKMVGDEFPLVFWRGKGRVLAADEAGLDLLVRGLRARYTWERLSLTLTRLLRNHTLSVDELGGGHDAVGIVSVFALLQGDDLDVVDPDGLLVLKERPDTPVHQFADMTRPTSWAPWRRKIYGD
ncbi:MAG: hypothetical protein WC709_00680 [Thermoleophilia bacterium]